MIKQHKTNINWLVSISIVYIPVISTVVVKTRNGTHRGICAQISDIYKKLPSFKKKDCDKRIICTCFQWKYESPKVIRNFSNRPLLYNGRPQLQKCNNEQNMQAWILSLTSKFVHCILYSHDTFTSELTCVHQLKVKLSYLGKQQNIAIFFLSCCGFSITFHFANT